MLRLLTVARFLAGLPHGAYFGVAALFAADLPGPARAQAVAQVLLGLSVANVVGVPLATWLGQGFGWRAAFAAGRGAWPCDRRRGACASCPAPADRAATLRRELGALKRPQVLARPSPPVRSAAAGCSPSTPTSRRS